jgi:hypothetical protein
MIWQRALNYSTFISVVGCIAAMMSWADSAAGGTQFLSLSPPMLNRNESRHLSGDLRFRKAGEVKSKHTIDPTEHLLVANQSCLATLRNSEFSSAPLLGKAGKDGDWVLLAGVSMIKATGVGKVEPILTETTDGYGLANWYYTVEMLFIPRDRWRIRASLAFDYADIHDALVVPSPKLDPLHFGVAISFYNGTQSPMVLDLGYGRLQSDGRVPAIRSGSGKPDQGQLGDVLSETWVVSACLNIQF